MQAQYQFNFYVTMIEDEFQKQREEKETAHPAQHSP
jgi:hypothetical protein